MSEFLSTSLRIRRHPKRSLSLDTEGKTTSVYYIQHTSRRENFDDDGGDVWNEETTFVDEKVAGSCQQLIKSRLSFDENRNLVVRQTLNRGNSTGSMRGNMLSTCENFYQNSCNQLVKKNSERPQKPKRSMKFDRDRCTFIKGSSVDDVTDSCQIQHSMSQQQFDAYIASEKRKYSGVVETSLNDSMLSMASVSSLSELVPWMREVYLEQLRLSNQKKSALFASALTAKHMRTATPTSPASELSLELSPRSADTPDVYRSEETTKRSFFAYELSPETPEAVSNIQRVLDQQIEQIEELLSLYEGPNGYVDPPSRTELPSLPEPTRSFAGRCQTLRKSVKNFGKRILSRSGFKITFPVVRKSIRIPKTNFSFRKSNRYDPDRLRNDVALTPL